MESLAIFNSGVASSAQVQNDGQKLSDDFDNFLILLTTQLQNQDPLDPMDSNEFTNQLISFSTVEQQIRSNDLLEKQLTLDTLSVTSLGLGFIGLDVERIGDKLTFDGTNPLTFSYDMPEQAIDTIISIQDDTGRTIFTSNGETDAGLHMFTWDGSNESGFTVEDGTYTLTIIGQNKDGETVTPIKNVPGHVTGVETDGTGEVLLMVGDDLVPITSVRKATQGQHATDMNM